MHKQLLALILFLFAGQFIFSASLVHEFMNVRDSFKKISRADQNYIHEVVFAIPPNNIEVLENELVIRSTPGSPKYQQWLSFEELGILVTNHVATEKVTNFVSAHASLSLHHITANQDYITVRGPISAWEQLLQTTFFEWKDEEPSNKRTEPVVHIYAESYTLPSELHSYVSYILNVCQIPPVINKHIVVVSDTDQQQAAVSEADGDSKSSSTTTSTTTTYLQRRRLNAPSEVNVPYLNSFYHIPSNTGKL